MSYFKQPEKLLMTKGISKDLSPNLIRLIITSIFKLKYEKDYLQVIVFEKKNNKVYLHIKQEETDKTEKKDTVLEVIEKLDTIPEKIYFIEDVYPTERVQTLLFASEY